MVDIANAYFAMKDGTLEVDPYVDPRTVVKEDAAASDTAQTAPDAANDAQTDATAATPQQTTALAGAAEGENNDALPAQ